MATTYYNLTVGAATLDGSAQAGGWPADEPTYLTAGRLLTVDVYAKGADIGNDAPLVSFERAFTADGDPSDVQVTSTSDGVQVQNLKVASGDIAALTDGGCYDVSIETGD